MSNMFRDSLRMMDLSSLCRLERVNVRLARNRTKHIRLARITGHDRGCA